MADNFEAQEGVGAEVDEADEADERKRRKVGDIAIPVEEAEESQLL